MVTLIGSVWKCYGRVRSLGFPLYACFRLWCSAGADVLGDLACSGIGTPLHAGGSSGKWWAVKPSVESKAAHALQAQNASSNKKLARQLREDVHGIELHDATLKDASVGRMSKPSPLGARVHTVTRLQPRFGVVQSKTDGSAKLRPVDHFSWAACRKRKRDSVNGCTYPSEKLKHDTLDVLAAAMRRMQRVGGFVPGLGRQT